MGRGHILHGAEVICCISVEMGRRSKGHSHSFERPGYTSISFGDVEELIRSYLAWSASVLLWVLRRQKTPLRHRGTLPLPVDSLGPHVWGFACPCPRLRLFPSRQHCSPRSSIHISPLRRTQLVFAIDLPAVGAFLSRGLRLSSLPLRRTIVLDPGESCPKVQGWGSGCRSHWACLPPM